MARAKIYEMFLRDGLQSVRTMYTVQEKMCMFDLLNKCNYNGIEFGSTTSPKLVPQMGGSFELWNHVKAKGVNCDLTTSSSFPQDEQVSELKGKIKKCIAYIL